MQDISITYTNVNVEFNRTSVIANVRYPTHPMGPTLNKPNWNFGQPEFIKMPLPTLFRHRELHNCARESRESIDLPTGTAFLSLRSTRQ